MTLIGTQYTVTATATQPFASASLYHFPFQSVDIWAPTGNAGTVYGGNSNVTNVPANALFAIEAGKGYTIGPFDNGPVYLDEIYIVGTASDKIFIHVTPR